MKLKKYTFRSPLFGSICCDELFSDTDGRFELSAEGMAAMYDRHGDKLMMFLTDNLEDLGPYVPEKFKGYIVKAIFGEFGIQEGRMWLKTQIFAIDELIDEAVDDISNWIEGQMSDGWGEGIEQREWMRERQYKKSTVFDEYTLEFEEEEEPVMVDYHINPWNHGNFDLVLEDVEEEEWDDGKVVATLNIPGKELQVIKVSSAADLNVLLTAFNAQEMKRLTGVDKMTDNVGPYYLVRELGDEGMQFLPKYVHQDGEVSDEAFYHIDEESCYPMKLHKAIIELLK